MCHHLRTPVYVQKIFGNTISNLLDRPSSVARKGGKQKRNRQAGALTTRQGERMAKQKDKI
jgi:hypothetical protein